MGADLIGEYVDAVVELATDVHALVAHEPELEFAAAPELSTLVFRYVPVGDGLDEPALAELNKAIRSALYESGRAMVAATRVDGRQYLKLTLLNPMASTADIVGVLDLVRSTGARLAAGRTTPMETVR